MKNLQSTKDIWERKKWWHVIVIQSTLAEFVAKSKRQQIECHNNKRLTKQLSAGKANDQEPGHRIGRIARIARIAGNCRPAWSVINATRTTRLRQRDRTRRKVLDQNVSNTKPNSHPFAGGGRTKVSRPNGEEKVIWANYLSLRLGASLNNFNLA